METVTGYAEHIVYKNPDNAYTVFELSTPGEDITCVGIFQGLNEGEKLKIHGEYVEHPIYGRQFKASSFEILALEDVLSIERYLGSGAVKGIGKALAKRIVSRFGEDTLRILEEEPEKLAEVKGISLSRARDIADSARDKTDMRNALAFLQRYGIGAALGMKIYNRFGVSAYGLIQENPYIFAEVIEGVGFRKADEIAEKTGIKTDSEYRIRCGILYTLSLASGEGHTYLPMEVLLTKSAELLGLDTEYIEPQVKNLMMDKKIVIKQKDEEVQVFPGSSYFSELNCARMLHDLNIRLDNTVGESRSDDINRRIASIEKGLDIELDELQRRAVYEAATNGIFVLSGGPGTGKTTTISTIIRFFELQDMSIMLAAPTGRAAKRMTEATGYEARTIHRLLEVRRGNEDEGRKTMFEHDEDNPLDTDVVIVDEMSMVDIFLFQSLLRAINIGTRLIMVGDVNQLPSVGPGRVLRDIMDSGCFKTVILEKIFRQAGESDIVVNAHRIHAGEAIKLDNKSRDFFFLERNDSAVIYKHMVQLITEKLPSYVNAGPTDIQVLTPMKKGALGVEQLNRILQDFINPADRVKRELTHTDRTFREGDKVMQTKNNYQLEWEIVSRYNIPVDRGLGVFNGDIGTIKLIDTFSQLMVVEYDEHKRVTYPFGSLEELELAYAISIHKSQGSEYPAVIMPLLDGPRLLMNRSLLYTGVTRAKSCVCILGSRRTVQAMIDNEYEQKRYTALGDRIKECIHVDFE